MTKLISYIKLPTKLRLAINNLPDGMVYIGAQQPFRGINITHPLHNPFGITKYFTRAMSEKAYRNRIFKMLDAGSITESDITALEGKTLISYEANGVPVHGHIIIEMIEAINSNQFDQYKEYHRGN